MRVHELVVPAVCEVVEVTLSRQRRIVGRVDGNTLGAMRLAGTRALQALCNHTLHRGGTKPCRMLFRWSTSNDVDVVEIELVKWIACGLLARGCVEHAPTGMPSLWRLNRA